MVLPSVYEVVHEPLYDLPQFDESGKPQDYRMPHPKNEHIYFGDDYGGHNIPFPHPAPPAPHKMYQQEAFVNFKMLLGLDGKKIKGSREEKYFRATHDQYSPAIGPYEDHRPYYHLQ